MRENVSILFPGSDMNMLRFKRDERERTFSTDLGDITVINKISESGPVGIRSSDSNLGFILPEGEEFEIIQDGKTLMMIYNDSDNPNSAA